MGFFGGPSPAAAGAIVAAAGTAYSAHAASQAAKEQATQLARQAQMQAEQARLEEEAGKDEAAHIRDKGRRIAAAQNVTMAASGVRLDGAGTSATLLAETDKLTEHDALAAIASGSNRSKLLMFQSSQSMAESAASSRNAKTARIVGFLNAGSSLIAADNAERKSKQGSQQARFTLLGE